MQNYPTSSASQRQIIRFALFSRSCLLLGHNGEVRIGWGNSYILSRTPTGPFAPHKSSHACTAPSITSRDAYRKFWRDVPPLRYYLWDDSYMRFGWCRISGNGWACLAKLPGKGLGSGNGMTVDACRFKAPMQTPNSNATIVDAATTRANVVVAIPSSHSGFSRVLLDFVSFCVSDSIIGSGSVGQASQSVPF